MNHKAYFKSVFGFLLTLTILTSCVRKDDWETPPINCNNKFKEPTMSMADFVAQAPSSGTLTITTEQIFEGYVISSDEQGNFYKTISFQDKPENPTVGLQMEVDRSSNYADLPVGSHIRISAKGLVLGTDRGVVKLGSVDPTYAIGRIPSSLFGNYISTVCSNGKADIVKLTPLPLATLAEAKQAKHINKLVTVPNVQFTDDEVLLPTGYGGRWWYELPATNGHGEDRSSPGRRRHYRSVQCGDDVHHLWAKFVDSGDSLPSGRNEPKVGAQRREHRYRRHCVLRTDD